MEFCCECGNAVSTETETEGESTAHVYCEDCGVGYGITITKLDYWRDDDTVSEP